MTTTRETRLYVREGTHSPQKGMDLDDHVVLFKPRAFAIEGLDHLAYTYQRRLPITVVKTNCPDAHKILEGNGYTRVDRGYKKLNEFPAHENDF